nr:hypothetical protein [Halobaculum gomorrense]
MNLVRDDTEPVALAARAGGLDVDVEREQVRLLGDVVDHVDELGDVVDPAADPLDPVGHRLGGVGDAPDRLHRLGGRLLAPVGRLFGLSRSLCDLLGRGGHLLDRRREVRHLVAHGFHVVGLLAGQSRNLRRRHRDLFGCRLQPRERVGGVVVHVALSGRDLVVDVNVSVDVVAAVGSAGCHDNENLYPQYNTRR